MVNVNSSLDGIGFIIKKNEEFKIFYNKVAEFTNNSLKLKAEFKDQSYNFAIFNYDEDYYKVLIPCIIEGEAKYYDDELYDSSEYYFESMTDLYKYICSCFKVNEGEGDLKIIRSYTELTVRSNGEDFLADETVSFDEGVKYAPPQTLSDLLTCMYLNVHVERNSEGIQTGWIVLRDNTCRNSVTKIPVIRESGDDYNAMICRSVESFLNDRRRVADVTWFLNELKIRAARRFPEMVDMINHLITSVTVAA